MRVIWDDAPVPVSYKASRLSIAFILKLVFPVVLFIISIIFVVMSNFTASGTIKLNDSPVVEVPEYYFAFSNLIEGANMPFGNVYSNFPAFQSKSIISMGGNAKFQASVDLNNRINIKFSYSKLTSDTHLQTLLYIPLALHFTKFSYPVHYTLLSFAFTSIGNNHFVTIGDLFIKERKNITQEHTTSLETFLGYIQPGNFSDLFSVEDVIRHFSKTPIKADFRPTSLVSTSSSNTETVSFEISTRMPSMTASYPSSYWYLLRSNYVQIFYWTWAMYALIMPFIESGYKFGIIGSTVKHILKPVKKQKMD